MKAIVLLIVVLNTWILRAAVPVLQGPTSELKTQILVLRKSTDRFEYRITGSSATSMKVLTSQRPPSSWVIDNVLLETISSANPDLNIEIWNGTPGSSAATKVDDRKFSFLRPRLGERLKVALVSCASDRFTIVGNKKPWDSVKATGPEVLIWLGDNVYAAILNPVSPEQLWTRHAETRKALGVFFWPLLVPSFAVWDDHDYGGGNDGNSSYIYKNDSKTIFKSFFGSEVVAGDHEYGPGVSSAFTIGENRFVLMDGRSFRSTENASEKSVWGLDQRFWMGTQLAQAEQRQQRLWVANGYKFLDSSSDGESLAKDQPLEYAELLHRLSGFVNRHEVHLLSGDVHFSEISKRKLHGNSNWIYEITSSSIHSVRSPGSKLPKNPERVVSHYGDSFVVLDIPWARQISMDAPMQALGYASNHGGLVFALDLN